MQAHPEIDLVIPVYNEASVIHAFHARLIHVLETVNKRIGFIYVNDGSTDETQACLMDIRKNDPGVVVIELSRNFGHQAALSCGIDASQADWVITLDGDGEHPPEIIPEMIRRSENGFDIIFAQREEAQKGTFFKNITSKVFNWMMEHIAESPIKQGVGDYRMINRQVIQAMKNTPDYHRFLRGTFEWIGFNKTYLPYSPGVRIAGKSKYSLKKMINLALNASFFFSQAPVQFVFISSIFFFLLSFGTGLLLLLRGFMQGGGFLNRELYWLVFIILLCTSSILFSLGIIGIMMRYTMQEINKRPPYIIKRVIGMDHESKNGLD